MVSLGFELEDLHEDMQRNILAILLLFIGCSMLTSCYLMTSPEDRVAQNRDDIQDEFYAELKRQQSKKQGGRLELTWNQALEKMYMENPRLLEADFKVEDAVNQQKRVYTSLIPLVSVGVSDSFEIQNLDEAFSDVSLRVYSYLPLGEVVRLPKQIYTKKLLYMGAQLNAEQAMRQEVIALYRLFQKQYLLELEKKALLLERALTKSGAGVDDVEALKLREEHLLAFEGWVERYEEWRVEVGDFFMGDYAKVELVRRSLPKISYKPSELDFTDSGRWGMLQLNLLAMERISEDAKIVDTYLRYFPRPNFNVSAPPLYSDTSSNSFDPAEIRIGPSLNWSLDTRGTISDQLNRIKRQKPLSDWRDDKRRRGEIKKLLDGKEALVEIQTELSKLREVIEAYKKAVKSGLVESPIHAIRTMRNLRERELRIVAKEIEIHTSFWLIDETRWAKITQLWQKSRVVRAEQREEERERQAQLEKGSKKSKRS